MISFVRKQSFKIENKEQDILCNLLQFLFSKKTNSEQNCIGIPVTAIDLHINTVSLLSKLCVFLSNDFVYLEIACMFFHKLSRPLLMALCSSDKWVLQCR